MGVTVGMEGTGGRITTVMEKGRDYRSVEK